MNRLGFDTGYVNLFAHYRPAGDPQWFLTPTGAPPHDPALEIEPPFALGDARDDAGAAGFDGDDAPLRVTPLLATLRSRGSGEL